MSGWRLPWEGGCRCGRVRLRVVAPPLLASACHCTGCQSMSASAFALSLTLPGHGLEIIAGEPVIGGRRKSPRHFFCVGCMTWMFTRPGEGDLYVNLRPSMLDEHAWFAPFAEMWTREKLAWVTTPAERRFETDPAPADWPAMARAFSERGARPT